MAYRALFALLLVLLGGRAEAQANTCLLCAAPRAGGDGDAREERREQPLRIDIVTDLDFARVLAAGRGGALHLRADGGGTVEGDVRPIGAGGFTARVAVSGTPGRIIRIELPDRIALRSPSGREAEVSELASSVPLVTRLGSDGRLDFALGGRLRIEPGVEGAFRGNIRINVSYE